MDLGGQLLSMESDIKLIQNSSCEESLHDATKVACAGISREMTCDMYVLYVYLFHGLVTKLVCQDVAATLHVYSMKICLTA